MKVIRTMKTISYLFCAALCLAALPLGGATALTLGDEGTPQPGEAPEARQPAEAPDALQPGEAPEAPAEVARRSEKWKQFREHVEKLGRKDLLPEEIEGQKPPTADAMIGILFRISPDLAAAHDMLDSDRLDGKPADVAGARSRLAKLAGTTDPYLSDYAKLLGARADLLEKKYPEAAKGFESVLGSTRNLAAPAARRGLAESYRGMNETTFEALELRLLLGDLPQDRAADRGWAEERLAEIRRDHPGPLNDSEKRMRELSKRLAADQGKQVTGDQQKVEDILIKVARILEDESKRCLACSSVACKACKKCGACTAAGMCEGEHTGPGNGSGSGKGGLASSRKPGGPRDKSSIQKEKPGEKHLRESTAKDADAWGSVNEREVAKALQDLWGKIPPSYRQTVAQYFKDISGVESAAPKD